MRLPDMPQPDRPITVAFARQVIDALRAVWPQSSPSVRVSTLAGGTTFEARVPAPSSSTPIVPAPWQPYDLRGLSFAIRKGYVMALGKPKLPSNAGARLVVPANQQSYFVWLAATIVGDIGRETVSSLVYGHGAAVPDAPDPDYEAGTAPGVTYFPLISLKTNASGIAEAIPFASTNLSLALIASYIDCDTNSRQLQWGGYAGYVY